MKTVAMVILFVVLGYTIFFYSLKTTIKENRDPEFIELTRLECHPIKDIFKKSDFKNVKDLSWDFISTLNSCGEIGEGFFLRKSLIRYKQRTFYHNPIWGKNGSNEITEINYNIPYCVVGTDKAEVPVEQKCEDIK